MELSSRYFVGKQSIPDVPSLDDEDDDCEDDDKENIKEERKITACLPYYILIPLPANRNFCDLTFRHGHAIGSLLACDAPDPSEDSECAMDNAEHHTECNRAAVPDTTGHVRVGDCMEHSTSVGYGIEHTMEHNMEHNREHNMKHNMEHNMKHTMEHNMEHNMEPNTEHNIEHTMEHDMEHTMEHNMEHVPDNATVKHTQKDTTEHLLEHSVVENNEDATRHTKCDPQLSIEEYLQLCVEHLNFSEIDVMFAKSLYDTICHAGVMGVPQSQLEQVCWYSIFLFNAHMCLVLPSWHHHDNM